ncbi:hypothetical protein V1477_001215 [Vespula maculifrons]|uniref:Uncharacterized protein n=1 Tax=Vespula maculifrons TaxID=7453 RepID=A0ABD2CZU7_VESMC
MTFHVASILACTTCLVRALPPSLYALRPLFPLLPRGRSPKTFGHGPRMYAEQISLDELPTNTPAPLREPRSQYSLCLKACFVRIVDGMAETPAINPFGNTIRERCVFYVRVSTLNQPSPWCLVHPGQLITIGGMGIGLPNPSPTSVSSLEDITSSTRRIANRESRSPRTQLLRASCAFALLPSHPPFYPGFRRIRSRFQQLYSLGL